MKRFLFILFLIPVLAFGQAFSFNDIAFMGSGFTDWAQRVVNNGGPRPTALEITTMETYRRTLIDLGLTNSIYTLCIHSITSSVIGASTPLIKNRGSDPWINTGFGATNLNVDGLKGDGSTKCLDTGLAASDNNAYSNSFLVGLSMVVTESDSNRASVNMGARTADGNKNLLLLVSSGGSGGRTEFYTAGLGGDQFIITNDFVRVGYISANVRTNAGLTNQTIYIASPLEPHRVFATEEYDRPDPPGGNIVVFGNKFGSTNNISSAQRIAMSCVHFPWTQVQSSNFWWATKTCLESLGGAAGDPVKDWSRRLTELGGPAISVNSSNALRAYYGHLGSSDLIKTMQVANCYLPDSLFADKTPLIWQHGHQSWSNSSFGETNVSVNGLKGNTTTKFFGTAIRASAMLPPFTSDSAGISLLIYSATNTGAASLVEFGMGGSAPNSFFAIQHFAGALNFYCWAFATVNANFVQIAAPHGSNWSGYISGNRTSSSAIRLDWVTNGVHNVATNGTSSRTVDRTTITNAPAHAAYNFASTPANWSDRTVSYLSIHSGHTQTQSSNEWYAVFLLRTILGGGLP